MSTRRLRLLACLAIVALGAACSNAVAPSEDVNYQPGQTTVGHDEHQGSDGVRAAGATTSNVDEHQGSDG